MIASAPQYLLCTLVTSALEAYGGKLGNGAARQAYEAQFPRLVMPGSATTSSDEDDDAIRDLSVINA